MKFTELEKKTFEDFMSNYLQILGNSGCNDFSIPNTEEGRKFAIDIVNNNNDLSYEDRASDIRYIQNNKDKELIQMDFIILHYLLDKIRKLI